MFLWTVQLLFLYRVYLHLYTNTGHLRLLTPCLYFETIATYAVHLLTSGLVGFDHAGSDQSHRPSVLLLASEPIKAGHQQSHDDDAIAGRQAELVWALCVVLDRGHTGASG